MKFVTVLALVLFSLTALAGAREADSFGDFNYSFKALPLEGNLGEGTRAWSGDYWAFKLGGINLRWNSQNPIGYNLPSPGKAELMHMPEAEIATLAATEKWAILKGDYSYQLVAEVGSYTGRSKKLWAGICHGWSPASVHHQEPTPKVLVNQDGIRVPFGSGDIKALLSWFYADEGTGTAQLGSKCKIGRWACGGGGDINPGALHVIMANKLGVEHEGFMMDRDPGREVWNQPVSGFSSKFVSAMRKTSKGYEVDVDTQLFYTDESKPTWDVVFGTENQKTAVMELSYTLELDQNQNIIDGEWRSGTELPDFVWLAPKISEFKDEWAGLDLLLND